MRRFRRERGSGRARKWESLRIPRAPRTVDLWRWGGNREIEHQWRALQERCSDRASRNRLARLIDRLTGFDRGARESALAEIELATLLLRSGCSVKFLPESQARTADLECHLGHDRFFVEVTALVGGAEFRKPLNPARRAFSLAQSDDEGGGGQLLIHRLLARISQKARQLSHYSDPVVLAITVPYRDRRVLELDLKELSGAITLLLPVLAQVSAVLLSLWDVEPAQNRSAVRLSNVHVVERSVQQRAYPRVRLLIENPAAMCEPRVPIIEALKGLLK
jgi:hypothetical protein